MELKGLSEGPELVFGGYRLILNGIESFWSPCSQFKLVIWLILNGIESILNVVIYVAVYEFLLILNGIESSHIASVILSIPTEC